MRPDTAVVDPGATSGQELAVPAASAEPEASSSMGAEAVVGLDRTAAAADSDPSAAERLLLVVASSWVIK